MSEYMSSRFSANFLHNFRCNFLQVAKQKVDLYSCNRNRTVMLILKQKGYSNCSTSLLGLKCSMKYDFQCEKTVRNAEPNRLLRQAGKSLWASWFSY